MGTVMLAFLAGIALGGIYFAGLWRTVRSLPDAEKPARRMAASFALRAALALAGFWLVLQGGWEGLVAAMAGFLAMREILLRRLGNTSYGLMGGNAHGSRGH
ncbi:MAG: ATP synthase subunit I [Pseudomonadota bacterium]|jgi:F1F0 ATPase subunit 2|nr:ATP synthase subunit I [Syntrophaceae bacterium]MDI9555712.1 ATP synthase subunit I [Pseudomonadota bacterium]NLX31223.1 ATP synthase subunit I [Deltaproteobacteria bacterium]HNU84494.1 ATP synthase subunit I [Syntrophales bacterium]HNZ34616.1 ATP synthase subunit I [Syntrophales bacterium]